ncbi:sulfatase-like hydrolase/transferase [Flammeovirga yaeyamensis]|uniref:Sulfatase-like hydrolase/transferase n=1 Tax=Flammeovirga yaeyamensis TaxID=367791 RepID=A0AAX1NDU3_9BACT|nr:sulfatase [Flammeovirga yaeyamensis]MBB3696885.1 arylsulfatase A-like enzyme [Flammeovirga yaeyamensis]NMF33550.1 sulfatase [Flammeovirga yaeyamensis]QWG05181.1 sulfatase-like hydrolase/transferase [Flammeovirga yaeyamensis]
MKIKSLMTICFSLLMISNSYSQDKKPNIVLFFVDDMGWKDPAFMGSDYHETPNLDQMASEGFVFHNAYSAGPNCAPSRASLMSGQYSPRHGKVAVWNSKRGPEEQMRLEPVPDQGLPLENYTLAEALRDGGYKTGIFGKWHIEGLASDQGFEIDGETDASEINFKETDDPKDIYSLTEKACQFLEDQKDQPFFLYLSHHTVHTKWEARQPMIDYFEGKEKGKIHKNAQYAAMVKHTDESMGIIMKKLKDLGIDDNTIVIFTSDNGAIGRVKQTPLRGAKGMLYEGGIRVPLVVRWPLGITPATSTEPIINIDFYPTFLELAGIKKAKDKVLDGESFVPLLTQKKESLSRSTIYYHYPIYLDGKNARGARDQYFRNRPTTVAINGDWKLLFFHEEYVLDGGEKNMDSNHMVELYNLKDDPSEMKDLSLVEIKKRDEMLKDLKKWMKKTNAPLAMKKTPENYRPVYKRGDHKKKHSN